MAEMTWRMVGSWFFHGAVTAAFGSLGFIAGGSMWAIATATGYVFREIRQHETKGTQNWLDRIMDAVVPVLVALGFAFWM